MFLYGRDCADQHDLMIAILLAAGGLDAESLTPNDWVGRVADVVFDRDDWIFEVKSVVVDRPSDPKVKAKLGEGLMRDAARFGGPIGWGRNRVKLADLPKETSSNMMRTVGRSVQKAVKDANQQIKATRTALGRPDAKGCVAIISPPHELLPQGMSWLVGDTLRDGRNSAINSVLIAQTPLLAPFGNFPDSSSYTVLHGVAGNYVPDQIKRKIARKWAAAHGTPMRESTVEDIDGMVQLVTRGKKPSGSEHSI